MNAIKRRVLKLEKKRGKGGVKFRLLILNDGDPDPPKIQDLDVYTMIMDLRQDRPDR